MKDDVKRRLSLGLILVSCAAATLYAAVTGIASAGPARPEPTGADVVPGPYRVVGNRVVGADGAQLVPYGFVIDCMALRHPIRSLCTGQSQEDPWPASAMLNAAARFWHANIVRFQVAEEYLFNPSGGINTYYLHLLDRLVDQATSLRMASIITLQEERFHAPPLPTATAVRFWTFMSDHFKNNPEVLFDLFNEPQLSKAAAGGETELWNLWRNGGTLDSVDYVGDQALVNAIRAQGANNVVIAEGNNFDRNLRLLPRYYLTGQNIAYGIEPNLSQKEDTPSEWATDYGDLSASVPIFPEAFLPSFEECNPAAPEVLPQLFAYLGSIHMGLIVWTLLPGETTVGKDLYWPTSFAPWLRWSDRCFNGGRHAGPASSYGDGEDILGFFIYHYLFGS